jgi:hypothetical protein
MRNFLVLSLAAVALACGGGSKAVRSGGAAGDETPAWVSQGSGAFTAESGKKLQGVGVVASPRDPAARRKAADAKAAEQLQAGVDTLCQALAKATESTKENVGDDIGAMGRKALQSVPHVRDHWVAPDGAEHALDQVDLAALKQALQNADGDERLRREMAGNLDRAFDQLARQ